MFCRQTVAQLRELHESAGLPRPLLFFLGDPEAGREFFARAWPAARGVSDPDLRFYAAFGLGRGRVGQLFGPGVWRAGLRAALQGHGVGKPVGDPRVLSGAAVVRGDEVFWEQPSEHAGDLPDFAGLLRAARDLGA